MSGAMIHAFQIAASLSLSLQSPSLRAAPAAPLLRAPPIAMGARKSRYADDGTREKGSDLQSGVDGALKGGLFSGFKWGTEVEVGDPKLKTPAKKGGKVFGDGAAPTRGWAATRVIATPNRSGCGAASTRASKSGSANSRSTSTRT
jgi:hypothetical protein